jgi:hypothetical protein
MQGITAMKVPDKYEPKNADESARLTASALSRSAGASLTAEIEGLYNQTCCRRQVAQLVFCPGYPDLLAV